MGSLLATNRLSGRGFEDDDRSTNTSHFDTNLASEAWEIDEYSTTSIPLSTTDDVWIQFTVYKEENNNFDGALLYISQPDFDYQWWLDIIDGEFRLLFNSVDGSAETISKVVSGAVGTGRFVVDLHISQRSDMGVPAGGERCSLYVNNVFCGYRESDGQLDDLPTRLLWRYDDNQNSHVSNLIVSEEPTLYHRMQTMDITGTGSSQGFTLDTIGDLSDRDDLTLMNSLVGADSSTFDFGAPHRTNNFISEVIVEARAAKTPSSGFDQLSGVANVSATEYQTAVQTLTDTMEDYSFSFDTNPDTGDSWTASGLSAHEFGVIGSSS